MQTSSVRAIVTSDWHADAMTLGVLRYREVEEFADTVTRHTIGVNSAKTPALFVFAGDLSDPDPPRCWRAAGLAVKVARELAECGIPSIWLTGNHDVLEDGEGSHTLMPVDGLSSSKSAVHVVDRPGPVYPFRGDPEFDELCVLCYPYTPRSHAYDPATVGLGLRHAPELVVGHLMLEGIDAGSETKDFARGRDVFLPIDEIRRRWPTSVIVNGHYHEGRNYRGVHIPGAPLRLTLGEAANQPRYLEIKL